MILGHIEEAVEAGARRGKACRQIGLDPTTLQRWRRKGVGDDGRAGPKTAPGNRLGPAERQKVLQTACSPEFRDLSPKQIVPRLADRGEYVASESTFYRVLREERMLTRRGRARAPQRRSRPAPKMATGPRQVWSWDITYLPGSARESFFFLYTVMDVWSRKIVAAQVHDREWEGHASALVRQACADESVEHGQVTLHSDNGGPMKGATMLATLQALGVVPSFSRPRVSDDNPYSEALFRTLKYRPDYPTGRFGSLEAAESWVEGFVRWYNREHLHSGVGFVTPEDRHQGRHRRILEARRTVFDRARMRHPERWGRRSIRRMDPVDLVTLNPEPGQESEAA